MTKWNKQLLRTRRGIAPLEAVLTLAVFFVFAMAMYHLALDSFAALYKIIAIHAGSPYI